MSTSPATSTVPPAAPARLRRLAEVMHPRDRGPYTDTEIVTAVSSGDHPGGPRRQPVPLTGADLVALRAERPTTHRRPPGRARRLLTGCPLLQDDDLAARVDEQLRLLEQLRDTGVRSIRACRGTRVTTRGLTALLEAVADDLRSGLDGSRPGTRRFEPDRLPDPGADRRQPGSRVEAAAGGRCRATEEVRGDQPRPRP